MRVLVLVALVLLTGCNLTDPSLDSWEVNRMLQLDSDMLIVGTVLVVVLVSGLVAAVTWKR